MKSGLDSIVRKLMGGEGYDPQEGDECKWCDYKRYCPLKTESPMELPRREFRQSWSLTEIRHSTASDLSCLAP